jgi:hypothetical protein
VEWAPAPDDAETTALLQSWQKRAIRLWGARGLAQYDQSRFREYAFSLKEVGLTRHRGRRDELAPHAVVERVRNALEAPDTLWKRVEDVAERTGLPTAQVSTAIRALHDFGDEIVWAPSMPRWGTRHCTTRACLAHAAPGWLRLIRPFGG